ncbi:hypothetical protein AQZ59_01774 [Trueperella bernardiae]|uniref:Uncharacterized protein n=1 Tax=Trueperella bernardiae TaxID=59561 RepID=A0A0W1KI21_9ACTO|nr:hypothetical protein AQZ59_01774 [Trueperella bernardiae]
MKNWNTLEADIDLIMNTHYTPGRNGRRIWACPLVVDGFVV